MAFPRIWRVKHKFPESKPMTTGDVRPENGRAYERYYLGNQVRFVSVPGEPFVMNQRLIAQSGTFAVPGVIDAPVEEILSGYPRRSRPSRSSSSGQPRCATER